MEGMEMDKEYRKLVKLNNSFKRKIIENPYFTEDRKNWLLLIHKMHFHQMIAALVKKYQKKERGIDEAHT